MGGSQSLTLESGESIADPGQKSVVTGPIDGVDADALFAAWEKFVRQGKMKEGKESKYEVEEVEGGVLVSQRRNIPEIFGGGDFGIWNAFTFDQKSRKIEAAFTLGDVYWERKAVQATTHTAVHSDPVRVEFWLQQHPVRMSGKILKGSLEPIIKAMGLAVEVKIEQPAISDAGKTSVVTETIPAGDVTPENFMQKFKEALIESCGGVELPDGTVAEDRSGFFELFKAFAKHEFETEKSVIYEYGDDETFSVLRSIGHLRVHRSPFRLEAWSETCEGRYAGEPERKAASAIMEKVLKFLQDGA